MQILRIARQLGDFLLVGIHDDQAIRYYLFFSEDLLLIWELIDYKRISSIIPIPVNGACIELKSICLCKPFVQG
jgi:hypothetical protein